MRERVKAEVETKGKAKFSKVDLDRLDSDDEYLERFWHHAQLMGGDTEGNTAKLVVDTFIWRNEFGVENIRKETINKE